MTSPSPRLSVGLYAALLLLTLTLALILGMLELPLLVVGGVVAVPWVLWFSGRGKDLAFRSGFFLVLIAETKFRIRDPLAATEGSVDAQVGFELFIYAFIAWQTLRALRHVSLREIRVSPLEGVLAAYVVLAVVSVAWTPIVSYTLVRALQLVILFAYAWATTRLLGEATWKILGASLAVYVVVFSFAGFVLFVTGVTPDVADRLYWFSVHPIHAGSLLALAALGIISRLVFREGRWRAEHTRWAVFAAALAVLVVLTRSRGPLFAFAGAAVSLVMIRGLRSSAAAVGVSLTTVCMLVLLNVPGGLATIMGGLAGSQNPLVELAMRGQSVNEFVSMTGRVALWEQLFPAVWNHPVLGHGYQVARVVGLEIAPWAGEAHNALLQSLIDLGFVGTSLLILPLLIVLFLDYRRLSQSSTRSAAGLGLLASQFAMLLFVLVNSVGTAGFAGVPGFEPLLLFTAASLSGMSVSNTSTLTLAER